MRIQKRSFDELLQADTLAGRIDALVELLRGVRRVSAATGKPVFEMILSRLVESPGRKEAFGTTMSAILTEADGTTLFGDTGIPSDRGFLAELGDRLSSRLVPAPRDVGDLSYLFRTLYRSQDDVERFAGHDPGDFHRFVELLVSAVPAEAWKNLREDFADGFRLLLARVNAQGLSRKLRRRSTPGTVVDSPFHRIVRTGDALLEAFLSGGDPSEAAFAFERNVADCRQEAHVVHRHLEDAGVNVDIVFGLEVIERCLTRASAMADIMARPAGPARSVAIQRLQSRLALSAHQDRSPLHLVKWNLHLLDRKIVDRSGQAGEHYVALSPKEYRQIWLAAAGGGLLTVLTAAVKMAVHGWHLAAFPESFLFGLNYALSFLLLQRLHLVLATKQPAMTAAALAQIMRSAAGEDREERIAQFFMRLTSSQIAAAASNVISVAVGAVLFGQLWDLLVKRPFSGIEEARHTFETLSPLDSGTVFFAALTGVLLWLASLAGGWFENWATYHRVPEGLAQHELGDIVGRERMKRFAASFARNASGWATNVSLGFLLGFAPAVGRFFGIPFDVRHVTLSTGTLVLAAVGLGAKWYAGGWFLRALAGIGVMFVLNLSVSFALSLFNAARAYEMPASELAGVLKHVLRLAAKRPLDFLRPPRTTPSAVAEPG